VQRRRIRVTRTMMVIRLYGLDCVFIGNARGIARQRRVDSMANATRINRGLLNGRAGIDIAQRVYAPALVL
jgi:hypothetical protein